MFKILKIHDSHLLVFIAYYLIGSEVEWKTSAIIGGKRARYSEFPYVVSLRNKTGLHYCGGALITRRHVVTAGHCLYADSTVFSLSKEIQLTPKEVKVLVDTVSAGWFPAQRWKKLYAVKRLTPHPQYRVLNQSSLRNDIGIIELEENVRQPSVLPVQRATREPFSGYWAKIVGWGVSQRKHQNAMVTTSLLQKLDVVVVKSETCASKFKDVWKAMMVNVADALERKSIYCAFAKESGPCFRDSGGPMVMEGELVGVIIFGVPCARNYPDIFTSIAHHKKFIDEQIDAARQ